MPRPLTEEERQQFLADKHVAIMSVESDGGRPPLTISVWYAYQPGGNVIFFTGTQGSETRKTGLIEKAGKLSISVQKEDLPYKYVTVEGSLERIDRPPAAEDMLAVVSRYLPPRAAQKFVQAEIDRPDNKLVLFVIRPDRWLSLDFAE